uniref:LIM domain-containing protein n=1 Tax=Parastrongyloides trichosuri TaxID=131310 RepID=A0A0N4Z9G2_PARTI
MASEIVDYETKKYLQELDSFGLPPPQQPLCTVNNDGFNINKMNDFAEKLNKLNLDKQKRFKEQTCLGDKCKSINNNINIKYYPKNNEITSNIVNQKVPNEISNRKDEKYKFDRDKILLSKPVNENSMSYKFSEEEKKEIIDKEESKKLRDSVLRENRPLNNTFSSQNQTVEEAKQYLKTHKDLLEQEDNSLSPSFDPYNVKKFKSFEKTDLIPKLLNDSSIKSINNYTSSPSSTLSTDNGRWSNASSTNSSTSFNINNINRDGKKFNEENYNRHKIFNEKDDLYTAINKNKGNNFIKAILNDGSKKNNEIKGNKKVEFDLTPKIKDMTPERTRLPRYTTSPVNTKNNSSYIVGSCAKCLLNLYNTDQITYALEKSYHENCFRCIVCRDPLRGKKFYNYKGKNYCEEDYITYGIKENTEKCHECGNNIVDVVLTALGKTFHPQCFRCTKCRKMLDGSPFTVDTKGLIYCSEDYHDLYSPKCSKCSKPIISNNEITELIRITALNKDFHVDCYTCEGCGVNLKNDNDKRCYPLDGMLLCKPCNILWTRTGGAKTPITDL